MSAWADFAIALAGAGTGAGIGSYLGYRLGLRASEIQHVRERRLVLANQFVDAAHTLVDLSTKTALAKKRGEDLADQLHALIGQELRVAQYGNMIAFDHPDWRLDQRVTDADIQQSALIQGWDHAADPAGSPMVDASNARSGGTGVESGTR